MKKTIFLIVLMIAMLILPGCQWGYNPQTKAYGWLSDTISQIESEYRDPGSYLPTTYSSEEEFLTWLESQETFDVKYRRLFAIDKVRFKPQKIPEGYGFCAISVMMNQVTYCYKKTDEEVYLHFHCETVHYSDVDEDSRSKTFDQTMDHYDEIIQKNNTTYYVGYPRALHDKVMRGSIVWNIDNYRCAVYTIGINSFHESIIEYCDYEKVPLK